jgi:predicted negative regulator of RcsB-dependent stress response
MDHVSDQEQIDALKKWWKENGVAIVGGLALGLAGVFGWQFWQSHTRTAAAEASDLYQQVVSLSGEGQPEQAAGLTGQLRIDHTGSPYAALASFVIAAQYLEDGELAEAEQQLRWVVDSTPQTELVDVARLRLARVLLAQDKADAALAMTETVGQAFRAEAEAIRGDAFLTLNDRDRAREAYQAAQAAAALEGRSTPLLDMKLNDLSDLSGVAGAGTGQ